MTKGTIPFKEMLYLWRSIKIKGRVSSTLPLILREEGKI